MHEIFLKIQKRVPIIFSFIIIFIITIIELLIKVVLTSVFNVDISETLEYLIILVSNILVVFYFVGSYIFCNKDFKKSLQQILPLLGVILVLFAFNLYGSISDGAEFNNYIDILKMLFEFFVLAVAEELIYRGVLCNSLILKTQITRKGVIKVIVLDGIVFGLAHILNIATGVVWKAVVIQVIGASFFGMLEASIYISSGNIYIPIILHCVNNFTAGFDVIFIDSKIKVEDAISEYAKASNIGGIVFYILICIFVIYWMFIRKGKLDKLVENAKDMKNRIFTK